MSNILAFGDSPKLASGYGVVNRNILYHLAKQGHTVHQIAWGQQTPTEKLGDVEFYIHPPWFRDPLSLNTVLYHLNLKDYNFDYLFTSNDFFVWRNLLPHLSKPITKVSYSIVDGPFCADSYKDIIENIDIPVVATNYALDQVKPINDKVLKIPHGVDTSKFFIKDIQSCKDKLNIGNRFVIGSVNRNNWRKNYPALIYAFSEVKKFIADAVLLLVCDPSDDGGIDIQRYARLFDLDVSNDINHVYDILIHPDYINFTQSLSANTLVDAYNAMDCFVTASMGEGFGLTTLEAMSCGVPIIAPNNSCFKEVIGEGGLLYDSAKYSNNSPALIHGTFKETSYFLEVPDPFELANKIYYLSNIDRTTISHAAREQAEKFDWKNILKKWDYIFK